jgi:hypothetical protein
MLLSKPFSALLKARVCFAGSRVPASTVQVTDVTGGEIETNMDSAILDGGLLVLHFPWGVGAGGGGVARPGAVKSPCRILPHDSGRSSAQNPPMCVTA